MVREGCPLVKLRILLKLRGALHRGDSQPPGASHHGGGDRRKTQGLRLPAIFREGLGEWKSAKGPVVRLSPSGR